MSLCKYMYFCNISSKEFDAAQPRHLQMKLILLSAEKQNKSDENGRQLHKLWILSPNR